MADIIASPPDSLGTLASWFSQAVREELATLEKSGGTQSYEVLSGALLQSVNPATAIFQFIVADGTRIPEDASGRLKTNDAYYSASILRQVGDRIDLQVEGRGTLPTYIPHGMLQIDDTALLRKLAEVLEGLVRNPAGISPLAVAIFHPHLAKTGHVALSQELTRRYASDDQEKLPVISQACGSSLTYVWGPPGTGKTRLIAELIAELLKRGERVLVTSHTHAAVDQAIYASTKDNDQDPGPLAGSQLVSEGKVIRIGRTTDRRVPDSVRFDKVLEAKAHDMQARILELEEKARPLSDKVTACRERIALWERLALITKQVEAAKASVMDLEIAHRRALSIVNESSMMIKQCRLDIARAQKAWFFRESKVQRAKGLSRTAEVKAFSAELGLQRAGTAWAVARNSADSAERALDEARTALSGVPGLQVLNVEKAALEAQTGYLMEEIDSLKNKIALLQIQIISEARAVFCTLTKNYVGKELEGQVFDALIVDEISMAMPPLLFLAAGRDLTPIFRTT